MICFFIIPLTLFLFSPIIFSFPRWQLSHCCRCFFPTLYKATVELCRKVLATNLLNVTSFLVMSYDKLQCILFGFFCRWDIIKFSVITYNLKAKMYQLYRLCFLSLICNLIIWFFKFKVSLTLQLWSQRNPSHYGNLLVQIGLICSLLLGGKFCFVK